MKSKFVRPKRPLRFPLSIGDAAAAIGISAPGLRFYDKIVNPIRFGANGQRLYLPEHISAVRAYREQRRRKSSA